MISCWFSDENHAVGVFSPGAVRGPVHAVASFGQRCGAGRGSDREGTGEVGWGGGGWNVGCWGANSGSFPQGYLSILSIPKLVVACWIFYVCLSFVWGIPRCSQTGRDIPQVFLAFLVLSSFTSRMYMEDYDPAYDGTIFGQPGYNLQYGFHLL